MHAVLVIALGSIMIERFASLPQSLRERTRFVRLGAAQVPALLAHPDWQRPAPTMIWMHGRTVSKELDAGRYQRWLRAGIAACAVDLPGHGERRLDGWDSPTQTLRVLSQMVGEIDGIVELLRSPEWKGGFDVHRLGIGGMSAGGMATLRRLCDPHPFVCAAIEGTTGWLEGLYPKPLDEESDGSSSVPSVDVQGSSLGDGPVAHDANSVRAMDAMCRLESWRAIPMLALHAEMDQIVPIRVQTRFIESLRAHYERAGQSASLIEFVTFDRTGAPSEHAGFGKFGAEAKDRQTEFLRRWLRPETA